MDKSFTIPFLGRACLLFYDLHSPSSLGLCLVWLVLLCVLSNAVIGSYFLSHDGVSLFSAIGAFRVEIYCLELTHLIALGDTNGVIVIGVGIWANFFGPIIILLFLWLLMFLLYLLFVLFLLPWEIFRFLCDILIEFFLIGRRKSFLEISLEIHIGIHLSFSLFTLRMFYLHLLCLPSLILQVLWGDFGLLVLHYLGLVLFYYIIPCEIARLHK